MRFNIGTSSSSRDKLPGAEAVPQTGIPADHPPIPSASAAASSSRAPPPQCPMSSSQQTAVPTSASSRSGPAQCPVQHGASSGAAGKESLNPLNMIPENLSLSRQPGQQLDLPTDRTESSIPRPQSPEQTAGGAAYGTGNNWDYPSPQQFYNALVRKGWETPEDSVEVMVAIHNFLNERAWDEVLKWEKRLPGGEHSRLARFEGKPGELSPKARMHLFAGKIFPERFNTTPPFDRHDWLVTRPAASTPDSAADITTRYVIDYYSAPPDEDGNPVFNLDVRPALDSFESISQRVKVGVEEWMRKDVD